MALTRTAYPLDELRVELGIECLSDGRVAIPASFCVAALASFIEPTATGGIYDAIIEALEDVEEILGVCDGDEVTTGGD